MTTTSASPQAAPSTDLVNLMSRHLGQANGISAADLARSLNVSTRQLRRQISDARKQGIAISGTPSTGYYVAVTGPELEQCCAFLRARALHSLHLISVMTKVAMPVLLGQLLLAQG